MKAVCCPEMNQAGKKRDQKKVKVGKKTTFKQNQEVQLSKISVMETQTMLSRKVKRWMPDPFKMLKKWKAVILNLRIRQKKAMKKPKMRKRTRRPTTDSNLQ